MKDKNQVSREALKRRHRRIRNKIRGTAARPRLTVRRSLTHMTAVLVDDDAQRTIAQVSSTSKGLSVASGEGSQKMHRSAAVGAEIARLAIEKGIDTVAFDRGGRLYHGRVKAVADAARKGGLKF
ncbi:MAG: 50S ribosomal protein L18 [Gemmatimonadota bacterium]|nr:MAG: 50S ribosomal protein L18 [Gemmatimonadota bacterium]